MDLLDLHSQETSCVSLISQSQSKDRGLILRFRPFGHHFSSSNQHLVIVYLFPAFVRFRFGYEIKKVPTTVPITVSIFWLDYTFGSSYSVRYAWQKWPVNDNLKKSAGTYPF